MALLDKIRAARESVVTAGDFAFTIRRPTALEMVEMRDQPAGRAVLPFIVGWDKVRELDIIPGGDPHPLEFDAKVRDEWLPDRLDLLQPLIKAVFDGFTAHEQKKVAAKNA